MSAGAYFDVSLALKLGGDKKKLGLDPRESNAARIAQQAAEIDKLPILNFFLTFC
jgi:hypothetical protein